MSFNSNDLYLATGSFDRTIKIISISSFELEHTFEAHTGSVRSIHFHPLAEYILISASADKTIKIWNSEEKSLIKTIENPSNYVKCIRFDHDGNSFYSCSYNKTLKQYNFNFFKEIQEQSLVLKN